MNQNSKTHLATYAGFLQVQENTPVLVPVLDEKQSAKHLKALWIGFNRDIYKFRN